MSRHSIGQNLHESYVRQTRAARRAWADQLAAVDSRAAAEALRDRALAAIQAAFGPEPARCPLHARVTRQVERPDYRIENVIFESRPGYHVTANLYIPHGDGPFPAVLGACGHSGIGKAEGAYQAFCQGLARNGFLTLIYEAVSQGERSQYLGQSATWKGGPVPEHNMAGNPQLLLGDFFGMWRAWDGIRALDYLLSRPEADSSRVGMTGNSGGGTLTTYLNALDPRFTMAAPSCFVTSYLANIENELPADAEQIPPGILAAGLDMSAFFVARAPRPVLLLAQQNDFFDTRGTELAYQDLRRLYRYFDAEDAVQLFVGPRGHGYGVENREAMTRFFASQAGLPAARPEPAYAPEEPATLFATDAGQVLHMGSTPIWTLNAERAAALAQARRPLDRDGLVAAARRLLALPDTIAVPHYRALRAFETHYPKAPVACPFAVEAEDEVHSVLFRFVSEPANAVYHLPRDGTRCTLYLPDYDALADLNAGHVPATGPVFVQDLRGVGMARARTCEDWQTLTEYGADYFYASYANMLGRPLVGRRVYDLLLVLELLQSLGYQQVDLEGRGLGSVHATFAALLHPAVGQVTLRDALESYHAVVSQPIHWWPLSCFPPRVLQEFDLPDIRAALGARCVVDGLWPIERERPQPG